ncbi:hypothetical protein [Brevundimonas nasdae]|uniref:Uncharacterized protein n=1 Tax=Brevundimonas nasdae TaxID=172043 RepID=A0ABX8TPY3_9CAUL|nr:hypothetical protein [Brevundimonas nasdae]QYC11504.1 hypothetical protein KWG56_05875 [Brevundimonas nasdae]QYC14292.1 hypothetical protein KWG63_01210 [Brevundimonas nasdae]
MPREELWTWLNPPYKENGGERPRGSADKQTVSAASSLDLLVQDGSIYRLGANVLDSYAAYADEVHDRLVDLAPDHADYIVLETFAWLGLTADGSSSEWAAAGDFADRVEEALGDPTAGDARRFNSTKQASWRRWISFLGLGSNLPLNQLSFQPGVTRRLEIELRRAELPYDTPLEIDGVLNTLGQRMPYLDRGRLRSAVAKRCGLMDDPARLSYVMSAALRDLHDEGIIELERRGDAIGYVDLTHDPFHKIQSVLTLTLKDQANG